MNEQQVIVVPMALQKLIRKNNDLLRMYQQELLNEVSQANEEMMKLLQLNPEDGWQLDVDQMLYIKVMDEQVLNDTPVT